MKEEKEKRQIEEQKEIYQRVDKRMTLSIRKNKTKKKQLEKDEKKTDTELEVA